MSQVYCASASTLGTSACLIFQKFTIQQVSTEQQYHEHENRHIQVVLFLVKCHANISTAHGGLLVIL